MPEISHDQAACLRVMGWLLDDQPATRRSGRSMALALAFLRHAVGRQLRNTADREWIRIFDHFPMGADMSRIVLGYIQDIAAQCDVFVDFQERRFRLTHCTHPRSWNGAWDHLHNEYPESDIHRGLSPEQIEREEEMRAGPIRSPTPPVMLSGGLPRRTQVRSETLRANVVAYVRAHPGQTATQIATALKHHNDAVASTLLKEVRSGTLERRPGEGPRGGFSYYIPEVVVGPSVWERLRQNPYAGVDP